MANDIKARGEIAYRVIPVTINHLLPVPKRVTKAAAKVDGVDDVHVLVVNGIVIEGVFVELQHFEAAIVGLVDSLV